MIEKYNLNQTIHLLKDDSSCCHISDMTIVSNKYGMYVELTLTGLKFTKDWIKIRSSNNPIKAGDHIDINNIIVISDGESIQFDIL